MVLCIQEGVIVGQFDHLLGPIGGFVNDGQVEKPVSKKKKKMGESSSQNEGSEEVAPVKL